MNCAEKYNYLVLKISTKLIHNWMKNHVANRVAHNSVTFAKQHIQEQPLIFSGNLKACESAEILS